MAFRKIVLVSMMLLICSLPTASALDQETIKRRDLVIDLRDVLDHVEERVAFDGLIPEGETRDVTHDERFAHAVTLGPLQLEAADIHTHDEVRVPPKEVAE